MALYYLYIILFYKQKTGKASEQCIVALFTLFAFTLFTGLQGLYLQVSSILRVTTVNNTRISL